MNDAFTGLFESSASLTAQFTVVVPIAKVVPEAGEQAGIGRLASSSLTVGGA
jgi:hypothetical protein